MNLKVHHIGYTVKDIQQSIEMFQKIGYNIEKESIKDLKINLNF